MTLVIAMNSGSCRSAIEVDLIGNHVAKIAVDLEAPEKGVATPVSGSSPSSNSTPGCNAARLRSDRSSPPVRALRLLSQVDRCVCSTSPARARCGCRRAANRRSAPAAECLFIAGKFAERFAQQVTGATVAMHERTATLQRAQGVLQHAELGVALGFFNRSAQKNSVACHAKKVPSNCHAG